MQKAHLHEAILFVDRGLDEAVHGLERLKRARDSHLNATCFDEELVVLEDHRARLNPYFCSALQQTESRDWVRSEARYLEYKKRTLDDVQDYRDVRILEDRRRVEGESPKFRFVTLEQQHEWERQYPQPGGDAEGKPHAGGGQRP